ncbi:MAG: S8 family serine peptidase, partial [Oscillochloris sp.]|nr:S8 family serine peptidase [Oscillochloris sp.]
GYVAAWRAAGIFPVFAAGNTGNGSTCGSVQSPGDYAQVVGVGALDSSNLIASYSSIGPSSSGLMKPDISAPGTGIASTVSSSSYASMNGTSMATPQVAGTVALLWSANPSLIGDYDRTYEILTESAVPISGDTRFDSSTYSLCHASSSPNNIYGYGQLDAYAAVAEASVDVPWLSLLTTSPGPLNPAQSTNITIKLDANQVPGPGTYEARILVHVADLSQAPLIIPVTLTVPASASYATVSGQLTRATDGAALKGTVSVTNGPSVSSDDNGMYQITLLPSAVGYTLTASSYEYIPQTVSTTLAASENRTYNFALSANEARLDADTALLSDSIALGEQKAASFDLHNASTKSVTYSASIPAQEYGVWRSSQADGPAATWIDTPTDAVTLSLGDDTISAAVAIGFAFPFFEMRPETVRIAANGFLAFSTTTTSSGYTASCLPLSETTGAAIIPLRIDLNPTAGGRVSYARTADGFLVSWENVPLFSAPAHLESFQVLLGPDGRITLNYKQLSGVNPGGKPSAGLQLNSATTQSLGCGSSLSLGNNQTIELRPQPNTALWAALGSSSGSVLASSQISLPVQISWVRSTWPWPLSADIVVQSGDSAIPPTTLTVRMSMLAAPYNTFSPVIMREP